MQLVIDIDEKLYNYMQTDEYNEHLDKRFDYQIRFAVKDGTPLPKGHGRIGDLDSIMNDISNSINEMTNIGIMVDGEYLWAKLNDAIDNAQTIIPADTEVQDADSY